MKRSPLFFVLIILGMLLILGGIGFGTSSHNSIFKQVGQDTIKHYISDAGTGYLQMSNSPDLYVVKEGDFSPKIDGINTFQDGYTISFVADPTNTTSVDIQSNLGTHLSGTGENVVQINLTATNAHTEFTTATYRTNGQGYNQNNWGGAAVIILLGLLLAVGSFFLPRRKPQPGFGITPGMPIGQPMASPYQQPYQGMPPYQQPYQGAPPYQQATPYPGANAYNQQQPQYPSYPQQPVQPPTGYGQQPQQPQWPGQYPPYEPTQRANPYE